MSWPRPIPLVGDTTTAAQRARSPRGWAMSEDEQLAFYKVVAARRDVRRFRPDPVPDEIVERILGAAHAAPSVGHSQPWRFLVVTDAARRERAALLADAERLRQAAQLDAESARQLLDLKLEGLREAPAGIVVCCDRRTAAPGVLGRATFVDADMWSCACAVENLWLAARAEGLGLGWVTLFRPDDLAELLGLPEGVATLGWLCVGWPDERAPGPGLERAGWSQRQPLADVVIRERWPDTHGPGAQGRDTPGRDTPGRDTPGRDTPAPAPPPSRLRSPGADSVVAVRDDADALLTPPGSLGVLDRAVDRLRSLASSHTTRGALVLVGADHPVTSHGVSTFPASVTRDVMAAAVAGEALGVVAAATSGLTSLVVDAGVEGGPVPGAEPARCRGRRGDLVGADALEVAEVARLVAVGRRLGARLAAPVVALGEVGIGNTTVAAALAALQLDLGASDVTGLGAGGDSATVRRKQAAVAAAIARARSQHGAALADPLVCLAAVGGPELAVLAGVVLGAAQSGTLVVLDGLATGTAAVAAVALEPGVAAHLVAGQRSSERAHPLVLTHLGLEPLLDLRIRSGEGAGACLATGLLLAAARVRAETARTS